MNTVNKQTMFLVFCLVVSMYSQYTTGIIMATAIISRIFTNQNRLENKSFQERGARHLKWNFNFTKYLIFT